MEGDLVDTMTRSPSTLLAELLSRIETMLRAEPDKQPELIEIAERARSQNEVAWQMDTDDLYAAVEFDLEAVPDDPQTIAKWIGILDAWHIFANPTSADLRDAPLPVEAHRTEARLENVGRFNEDLGELYGFLIPATCGDAMGAAFTSRAPLVTEFEAYLDTYCAHETPGKSYNRLPSDKVPIGANQLLKNTAWLPPTIPCGHPDSTRERLGTVETGYIQIGALRKLNPLPYDTRLRVAVAPLAETSRCIDIVVTDAGSRYLVTPAFSIERVKAAIRSAFSSGCHLLLFPEMTINHQWLTELAKTVREEKKRNRKSALRFIIFGAVQAPSDGVYGKNYIALIDGAGNIVSSPDSNAPAVQHKICRWNLGKGDQRRYGFDRARNPSSPLADPVLESIEQAKTVSVFDIVGFGRLIFLICASLDHNQPSDWLVQHAQPDWIFAPVMDSSTCWLGCSTSPLEKWTIRRAVRAACLSRGKVVVSNSMALQEYENIEISHPDNPDGTPKLPSTYSSNSHPGVALLVDGGGTELQYDILRADIPSDANDASPILVTSDWNHHWNQLPRDTS